jgi:hypothetical protein
MGVKHAYQYDDFEFETDSILCIKKCALVCDHYFLILFESQGIKIHSAWSITYAELVGGPVGRFMDCDDVLLLGMKRCKKFSIIMSVCVE